MKTLMLAAACAATATACVAQETAFDGAYAGFYGSMTDFHIDDGRMVGAIAGYRMSFAESVILGIEGQAAIGSVGPYPLSEGYVIGHVGAIVGENILFYGAAGAGARVFPGDGTPQMPGNPPFAAYVLGGGVELAANDFIHLRGEAHVVLTPTEFDQQQLRTNFGALAQF